MSYDEVSLLRPSFNPCVVQEFNLDKSEDVFLHVYVSHFGSGSNTGCRQPRRPRNAQQIFVMKQGMYNYRQQPALSFFFAGCADLHLLPSGVQERDYSRFEDVLEHAA